MLAAIVVQRASHKTINKKWNISSTILIALLIPLTIITTQHQYYLSKANTDNTAEAISNLEKSYIAYKDNYLRLSDLHLQQDNEEEAKSALIKMTEANIYHALAFNKLGQLQSGEQAYKTFLKAVVYDPKNFFNYHANYYKLAAKTKDYENINEDAPKILEELKNYVILAENNIHYTAQTSNITDAIILAQVFRNYGPKTLNKDFGEVITKLVGAKNAYN
jgi:hypothetical protein